MLARSQRVRRHSYEYIAARTRLFAEGRPRTGARALVPGRVARWPFAYGRFTVGMFVRT